MMGSKVYVTLSILGCGAVTLALGPRPALFLQCPPDSDIFAWLQPRGVLNATWFIQVQRHARQQDVGSPTTNDDSTPGGDTGLPHPHLVAVLPRHEVGLQRRTARREVHRRIIGKVSIHDRHVERVIQLKSDRT